MLSKAPRCLQGTRLQWCFSLRSCRYIFCHDPRPWLISCFIPQCLSQTSYSSGSRPSSICILTACSLPQPHDPLLRPPQLPTSFFLIHHIASMFPFPTTISPTTLQTLGRWKQRLISCSLLTRCLVSSKCYRYLIEWNAKYIRRCLDLPLGKCLKCSVKRDSQWPGVNTLGNGVQEKGLALLNSLGCSRCFLSVPC